jgi:acyl-CoA synthetase (AMP-forming)/AMP-acid ligase II
MSAKMSSLRTFSNIRHVRLFSSSIIGADHPNVIRSPAPDIVVPSPTPNYNDFITQDFAKFGDKPAVIVANMDGSKDIRTFNQLLGDVDSVAYEMSSQLGFKAGDTALLLSPNHADYFTAVHATLRLRGVVSPANPLYTAHEIKNQMKDSGATLMIVHPMCLENAKGALDLLKEEGDNRNVNLIVLGNEGMGYDPLEALKGTGNKVPSLGPVADDALAVLPYSSGTTGLPKGTMLSHKNLVTNILQFDWVEKRFWNSGNEVIISPLPFFHIYGFTASLNLAIEDGSTVVTTPSFDMVRFLELIQKHKVSRAQLVPPIVLGLAKHPIVDKYDLSSLNVIVSGAAPLGAEVEQAASKRLNCIVKQAWGMSELAPLGCLNPDDDVRSGSSGVPAASMLYKIVDTETGELLPRGEEGEVVCAGPNVMLGYLNNEKANQETFDKDGWMRTGDIGKADEDGYITLTDRLKELIKYKGFQVPPAELEALLLTHPAIMDAAVIARPDPEGGEVPVGFVTFKPDQVVEPEEVADWVAERVAPHKKLRGGVVPLDVIPKSASGKILRRFLVDRDRAGEFTK